VSGFVDEFGGCDQLDGRVCYLMTSSLGFVGGDNPIGDIIDNLWDHIIKTTDMKKKYCCDLRMHIDPENIPDISPDSPDPSIPEPAMFQSRTAPQYA